MKMMICPDAKDCQLDCYCKFSHEENWDCNSFCHHVTTKGSVCIPSMEEKPKDKPENPDNKKLIRLQVIEICKAIEGLDKGDVKDCLILAMNLYRALM